MKDGVLGHLLGWFFSHLVTWVFLAFAVTAVLYREPLFGIGADATEKLQLGPPVQQARQHKGSDETGNAVQPEKEQAAAEPIDTAPVDAAGPAPGPPDAAAVFRPLTDPEPVASEPEQDPSSSPPRFRTPDRVVVAPQAGASQAGAEALLRKARTAYWAKDLEQAEALYLRYLALRPEDAPIFAELGNLYQSGGRMQDALDAYYEAGIRFRDQGARKQLGQVRDLMLKAGDARADELSLR